MGCGVAIKLIIRRSAASLGRVDGVVSLAREMLRCRSHSSRACRMKSRDNDIPLLQLSEKHVLD